MLILWLALACFAVGALGNFLAGLLGIGGGIIIIPVIASLMDWQGVPPEMVMHLAVGTSLAAVPFNATIAGISHHRRQPLEWKLVRGVAPGMFIGAMIGPIISTAISGYVLEWIFSVFLMVMGIRYTIGVKETTERHKSSLMILWVFSPIVGLLSSMLGLGGGVFVVPLLTRLGVPMRQALAVSSLCLVPASLVGVVGYIYRGWDTAGLPDLATGYVYWPIVFILMFTGILFAPLGVKWAHRLPHQKLKRFFGILLMVVATTMFYNAWAMHQQIEESHDNVSRH